jgi:hypothetical protein
LLGDNLLDDIDFSAETSEKLPEGGSTPPITDEADELLGQISAEVHLESKHKAMSTDFERQLEQRVDKLKELKIGSPAPSSTSTADPAARSKSGSATALGPPPKPFELPEDDEEEEMPWCCICNDDAVLRCVSCDGDLYCRSCYAEGHPRDDPEMFRHKTQKYVAPKSKLKR